MMYEATTCVGELIGCYEGTPGKDDHGDYVILPLECRDVVHASHVLTDEHGNHRTIREDSSVVINGIRLPKVYLE